VADPAKSLAWRPLPVNPRDYFLPALLMTARKFGSGSPHGENIAYCTGMKKEKVSMASRVEVTKQLKGAYQRAGKKEKGIVLDQFCAATGLSRSTARRYLTSKTLGNKKIFRLDRRRCRPTKYSEAAKRVLLRIWRMMGAPCGKYLAAARTQWIASLEAHGELILGNMEWTEQVRKEILAMSPATVDRYLKAERNRLTLKGISTTRPGVLLRNSITVRKASDEMEAEPGFFETDTVAHCGPTLKGEFARTLTLTDVHLGWIQLEVLRNNAHVHVLAGFKAALEAIPYEVQGLDCDNGSEFINKRVLDWAADKEIYFTRSRPYRKNDQAHVESKNNHAVRRYGFYYRCDTEEERRVLSMLWRTVCLKLNYFTPTRKPVGWTEDRLGRRKRVYDMPTTPFDRLLASDTLDQRQIDQLMKIRESINPATLTRDILRYQAMLSALSKDKTDQLIEESELAKERRSTLLQGGVGIKTNKLLRAQII